MPKDTQLLYEAPKPTEDSQRNPAAEMTEEEAKAKLRLLELEEEELRLGGSKEKEYSFFDQISNLWPDYGTPPEDPEERKKFDEAQRTKWGKIEDENMQKVDEAFKNYPKIATQAGSTFLGGYPETRIPAVKEYLSDLPHGQKATGEAIGYIAQAPVLGQATKLFGPASEAIANSHMPGLIKKALQALTSYTSIVAPATAAAGIQAHGEERDVGEAIKMGAGVSSLLWGVGSLISAGGRAYANRVWKKAFKGKKPPLSIDEFSDVVARNADDIGDVYSQTDIIPGEGRVKLGPAKRKVYTQEKIINKLENRLDEYRAKYNSEFDEYANDLQLTKENEVIVPGSKSEIENLTNEIGDAAGEVRPRALISKEEKVVNKIGQTEGEIGSLGKKIDKVDDRIFKTKEYIRQVSKKGATKVVYKGKVTPIKDREGALARSKESLKKFTKEKQTLKAQSKSLNKELSGLKREASKISSTGALTRGRELHADLKEIKETIRMFTEEVDDLTVGELIHLRDLVNSKASTIRGRIEGKHIGPKGLRPFLNKLDKVNAYIKDRIYSMYPAEAAGKLDFARYAQFREIVERISAKSKGEGYKAFQAILDNPTSKDAKILKEFMDPRRMAIFDEVVESAGVNNREAINNILNKTKWSEDIFDLPKVIDQIDMLEENLAEQAVKAQRISDVPVTTPLKLPGALSRSILDIFGFADGAKILRSPKLISALRNPVNRARLSTLAKMAESPEAKMAYVRFANYLAEKYDLKSAVDSTATKAKEIKKDISDLDFEAIYGR